jgi:hypothetical protein
LATTPSAAANSTFSIFMASITATRSPACTFWPGCTATSTSRPGMGDSTYWLMSGGALNGISLCSSAMRGRHHHGLELGAVVLHHQGQRVLGRAALHLGGEGLAVALAGDDDVVQPRGRGDLVALARPPPPPP